MKKLYFLLFLFLSAGLAAASANTFVADDSIGVERRGNQVFILHQVTPNETLTAIAARYKVSVQEIINANNLEGNILKVNQVIRVPMKQTQASVVVSGKVKTSYIVQAGDNLFRIANQFDMDVNDLKRLNDLRNDFISKGQELFVMVDAPEPTDPVTNTADYPAWAFEPATEVQAEPVMHRLQKQETLFQITQKYNITLDSLMKMNDIANPNLVEAVSDIIVGYKPVSADGNMSKGGVEPLNTGNTFDESRVPGYQKEEGIAATIINNNGQYNSRLFALHHGAPNGTLIKVTNQENNKVVVVRVIGQLSEADKARNTLIKLSQTASEKIGAINPEFRVRLEYNY